MKTAWTLALLIGALAPVVHAQDDGGKQQTFKRRTTAGQEVRIATYIQHRSDCSPSPSPVITVTGNPAHGTTSLRPGSVVAGPSRFGAPDCSGRSLPGMALWFTPEPGFTGSDRVEYTVQFSNGTAHDTGIVDVKP